MKCCALRASHRRLSQTGIQPLGAVIVIARQIATEAGAPAIANAIANEANPTRHLASNWVTRSFVKRTESKKTKKETQMYRTPIPKSIWFTVNRACNIRCQWCYAVDGEYVPTEQMSLEMAQKLLEIVAQLDAQSIYIIGGEPTLWPHLNEFNDICRKASVRTTLVTNALRFADDKYWEEYLNHPNDSAGISFKDCSPEGLLTNTRTSAFEKMDKGLRRGIGHFKKGLSFVYAKGVEGRMIDMVKYAIDFGARGLTIGYCTPAIYKDHVDSKYMVDTRIMVKETVESYEEIHALLHGAVVYSIKHPLCIWPTDFLKTIIERKQIMTTCHLQHKSGGLFDTDGSLLLCNSLLDFPVGKYGIDFNSADSLVEFMGTDRVNGYYDKLRCYPSKKCIGCDMYENCVGGCPLLWTAFNPDQMIVGCNTSETLG